MIETPEESEIKAVSLFSKKFREYLLSKKSLSSDENIFNKTPPTTKNHSTSSAETTASESSRVSGRKLKKKLKRKKTNLDTTFHHRLIQCSLLKPGEGVAQAEELKPLLLNMTILLQDLKESPSEYENLYNLISKIIILITEFIRRPSKKIEDANGEYWKKAEKTIETMMTAVQKCKSGINLDVSNSIREYKRIEKEITSKNNAIEELKKNLTKDLPKTESISKDLHLKVRNSILTNEKLKSDIKFNQTHVKRYKKVLLEKEWTKHKLENEVTHLKKKISKMDLSDVDALDKLDLNVSPELCLTNEHLQTSAQKLKNKALKMKKKARNTALH